MTNPVQTHSQAQALRRGAPRRPYGLVFVWLCLLLVAVPASLWAEGAAGLKVHAYTLQHRQVGEAMALIRPLLSAQGTVEEQRGTNTLVIRDTLPVIHRVKDTLKGFDRPPQNLRLEIQMVKAGPKNRNIISPPAGHITPVIELPADLEKRLKNLLRYEDYKVLARAGVSSKEGEDVTYSLGERYDVRFKLGAVMAGQRLKLEGFQIVKKTPATNKGRRIPPQSLFHATLNLWLDKPFTLVLAQDDSRQEALMIAISCYRDDPSENP